MTHVRALAHGFDLLALQQRAPARYPLLLESVASGTAHGRWDMLLAADGGRLVLGRDGRVLREGVAAGDAGIGGIDAAEADDSVPGRDAAPPGRHAVDHEDGFEKPIAQEQAAIIKGQIHWAAPEKALAMAEIFASVSRRSTTSSVPTPGPERKSP